MGGSASQPNPSGGAARPVEWHPTAKQLTMAAEPGSSLPAGERAASFPHSLAIWAGLTFFGQDRKRSSEAQSVAESDMAAELASRQHQH